MKCHRLLLKYHPHKLRSPTRRLHRCHKENIKGQGDLHCLEQDPFLLPCCQSCSGMPMNGNAANRKNVFQFNLSGHRYYFTSLAAFHFLQIACCFSGVTSSCTTLITNVYIQPSSNQLTCIGSQHMTNSSKTCCYMLYEHSCLTSFG